MLAGPDTVWLLSLLPFSLFVGFFREGVVRRFIILSLPFLPKSLIVAIVVTSSVSLAVVFGSTSPPASCCSS